MGQRTPTEAEPAARDRLAQSLRALRSALTGVGAAAAASSVTTLDALAKELSKAERRRRLRQRQREEEREEEREQRRAERRRQNDDDDDDQDQDTRLELIRARREALLDRSPGSNRRATARQSADDSETDGVTGGRQVRRQQVASDDDAQTEDDGRAEDEIVLTPPQTTDEDTGTATGSETAQIRVGSGDTFATIDPETGTATAESNGVRAIAGPDGAFIESTAGEPLTPTIPDDDLGDGNDDGEAPVDDGGNNGDDLLS